MDAEWLASQLGCGALDRVDRPRDRPQPVHGRLLGQQARPHIRPRAQARSPRRHRPRDPRGARRGRHADPRDRRATRRELHDRAPLAQALRAHDATRPAARRDGATARATGADTARASARSTGASRSCAAAPDALPLPAMPRRKRSTAGGARSSGSWSPKPAAPACSAATRARRRPCTSITSIRRASRSASAARGVTRSLAAARAEAAKCVLLCANCHAEVEAGVKRLTCRPMTGGDGAA